MRILRLLVPGEIGQKIDPGIASVEIFPFNSQGVVLPGADPQEDGVIAGFGQGADSEVFTELNIQPRFDAQIEDPVNLPLENLIGKAVFGDSVSDHAAEFRHHVEDRNIVTESFQEKRTTQSGGTAADHGDFAVGCRGAGYVQPGSGIHLVVGHKTLELVDGYRLIVLDVPAAVILTGVRADPAAGKQQGIALPDGMNCAGVVAFSDLRYVFRYIDLSRAGLGAGRQGIVFLVEMEQTLGHGSHGEDVFGAGLLTGTTPDAFDFINDRKAVRTDLYGVENACLYTVTQAQAAHLANPFAAV